MNSIAWHSSSITQYFRIKWKRDIDAFAHNGWSFTETSETWFRMGHSVILICRRWMLNSHTAAYKVMCRWWKSGRRQCFGLFRLWTWITYVFIWTRSTYAWFADLQLLNRFGSDLMIRNFYDYWKAVNPTMLLYPWVTVLIPTLWIYQNDLAIESTEEEGTQTIFLVHLHFSSFCIGTDGSGSLFPRSDISRGDLSWPSRQRCRWRFYSWPFGGLSSPDWRKRYG